MCVCVLMCMYTHLCRGMSMNTWRLWHYCQEGLSATPPSAFLLKCGCTASPFLRGLVSTFEVSYATRLNLWPIYLASLAKMMIHLSVSISTFLNRGDRGGRHLGMNRLLPTFSQAPLALTPQCQALLSFLTATSVAFWQSLCWCWIYKPLFSCQKFNYSSNSLRTADSATV